ncbi:MAG: methionyl-tRNA formyltransferase [Candidatus Caccosoma sp.]|nr:methionyl-tRNA formyltransferase [Candidatus Caccosoma sp.]
MNEKIVFFGTPLFASCILEGLISNGYNVIAVITQPDKLVGRKKILTFSPVKEVAIKHNIKVFQPISLKNDYDFLKKLEFDLLITAAYGQFLPEAVLKMAKINSINVHGSLLPKYRGGAPIQRAIINGEKETGITIIKMVNKMDAGVMYAKEKISIDDNINSTDLFLKMQIVGRDLLLKTLPAILKNNLIGEEQNEDEVTFAYNIKREEEKISFDDSAINVNNLIRGLSLTPGAYCYFKNKELKIYSASVYELSTDDKEIGSLVLKNKNTLLVRCKDGYLKILDVQLEGKQKMPVSAFLNGLDKNELVKEKLL